MLQARITHTTSPPTSWAHCASSIRRFTLISSFARAGKSTNKGTACASADPQHTVERNILICRFNCYHLDFHRYENERCVVLHLASSSDANDLRNIPLLRLKLCLCLEQIKSNLDLELSGPTTAVSAHGNKNAIVRMVT